MLSMEKEMNNITILVDLVAKRIKRQLETKDDALLKELLWKEQGTDC